MNSRKINNRFKKLKFTKREKKGRGKGKKRKIPRNCKNPM